MSWLSICCARLIFGHESYCEYLGMRRVAVVIIFISDVVLLGVFRCFLVCVCSRHHYLLDISCLVRPCNIGKDKRLCLCLLL